MSVFDFGTENISDENLKGRIRLSNTISFSLIVISTFFSILSFVLYRPITFLPLLGIGASIIIMVLNKIEQFQTGRIILSILPSLIIGFYHILIANSILGTVVSFTILQMLAFILPLFLYHYNEKGKLIMVSIVNFVIFLSFPFLNPILSFNFNDEFVRSIWFEIPLVAISISFLIIIIFAYYEIIRQSDIRNEELIMKTKDLVEQGQLENKKQKEAELAMQQSLKELEKAKEQEEKRTWVTENIHEFSELLRHDNDDFQQVYDHLISKLVRGLGATQGGLFIVETEGDGEYLELKSAFAYERKKFVSNRLETTEGVIGQAYLEKDYIYLKEIPKNYFQITSGLGEALPRELLLMPMKLDDEVEGIIELASFKPFEPHHIEFLQSLGEMLASAISRIKISVNTDKLLSKAQENAEILGAQEEEMRQNLEEMQATQEEFVRKEKTYIKKIEELEKKVG